MYRQLIKELRGSYRCIALDQLGFGLSGRSRSGAYTPADHARNLEALIAYLGLQDIVLVVHDFGGLIGLAYAINHPENVAGIRLFNTWMWSLAGHTAAERVGKLVKGPLGKWLYTRLNVSPRFLIKAVMGDKRKLTKTAHRQYVAPFPDAESRMPMWLLARELLDSGPWYDSLWQRRDGLANKPVAVLWGDKDPTFNESDLQRWLELWPHAEVVCFPNAGHFVQEEEGSTAATVLQRFLQSLPVAVW